MIRLMLDWLVRRGVLVASGPHPTHWCEEHGSYCPPRWYRIAGRP